MFLVNIFVSIDTVTNKFLIPWTIKLFFYMLLITDFRLTARLMVLFICQSFMHPGLKSDRNSSQWYHNKMRAVFIQLYFMCIWQFFFYICIFLPISLCSFSSALTSILFFISFFFSSFYFVSLAHKKFWKKNLSLPMWVSQNGNLYMTSTKMSKCWWNTNVCHNNAILSCSHCP